MSNEILKGIETTWKTLEKLKGEIANYKEKNQDRLMDELSEENKELNEMETELINSKTTYMKLYDRYVFDQPIIFTDRDIAKMQEIRKQLIGAAVAETIVKGLIEIGKIILNILIASGKATLPENL